MNRRTTLGLNIVRHHEMRAQRGGILPMGAPIPAVPILPMITPRRGIIDGVVIGTLDTVITGGAGADERYRDAYDEAYSNCMRSERTAYVVPRTEERIVVTARPEVGTDEWVAYCSAKYRSFDPETGTFVTYSGETLPCR